MASLNDTEVATGQILAGKFRIERVLGRGGMGVVVAATHLHLEQRVAIKFLLPDALKIPEAVKRFEREARAAVRIKSEHVARVTDVGTLETGSPYMVMEYLDGQDLSQLLHERGPLPIEEAVDYVMQAIEAIAEAHSLNIIHRDLKPANLFRTVRPDGTPSIKVLDFGISKLSGVDASMTQTSSMMGSPYYMSPEQMTSSKNVDPRADVWALGIILYELVSGSVPFDGDTVPEIVAKVLQNSPARVSRTDLPSELEAALHKALAKDREQRFADVAALAVALAPFGPSHSRTSVQRVSRVLGVATDFTLPDGSAQRTARISSVDGNAETTLNGAARTDLNINLGPPKHSYRLALGVGLTLLVGAGAFAAVSWNSQNSRESFSGVTAPSPEASPKANGSAPTSDKSAALPGKDPTQPAAAAPSSASLGSATHEDGTEPGATASKPVDSIKPADPAKPADPTKPASTATPSSSASARPSTTHASAPSSAARPSSSVSQAPVASPPRPADPPAPAKPPRPSVDLFSDRK